MEFTLITKQGKNWGVTETFKDKQEAETVAQHFSRGIYGTPTKARVINGGESAAQAKCESWNSWANEQRKKPEYKEYLRINRDLRS